MDAPDHALTEALARLGLHRDNWRAVALLPLVEVAWADGRIQAAERRLIVEVAARYGIEPGHAFLDRWLGRRPTRASFLHARTVLLQLWQRAEGTAETPEPATLEELLELCLRVAKAAGGLFGLLFTVEASERACMAELAESLQLGPALPARVQERWKSERAILDEETVVHVAGAVPTKKRKPSKPPSAIATEIAERPLPAAWSEEPTLRRVVLPFEGEPTVIEPMPLVSTERMPRPLAAPDEDVTSPYLDLPAPGVDPESAVFDDE